MKMRCTTERDQGGDDPFGGGENWQTHETDLPCSWWSSTGREQVSDDRSVVLADEHLIVARDADVVEGDRIVNIRDHRGRDVLDRARTVEYIAVQRSHLDCSLKAVS